MEELVRSLMEKMAKKAPQVFARKKDAEIVFIVFGYEAQIKHENRYCKVIKKKGGGARQKLLTEVSEG